MRDATAYQKLCLYSKVQKLSAKPVNAVAARSMCSLRIIRRNLTDNELYVTFDKVKEAAELSEYVFCSYMKQNIVDTRSLASAVQNRIDYCPDFANHFAVTYNSHVILAENAAF